MLSSIVKENIIKEYLVKIETDPESGRRVSERWLLNHNDGLFLHREDGPAVQQWDAETGVLVVEGYYRFGGESREGLPAVTERDPRTGETLSEVWSEHGAAHRDGDKPAVWFKDPETGVIHTEEYWQLGVMGREAGPAVIHRDPQTGLIIGKEFYRAGNFERLEGPETPSPT